MGKQITLKLGEIEESPVALRSVNVESVEFKELVDSVIAKGILNPIVVRESVEKPGRFILCDGLHRFTAANAAGLKDIPCHVLDMDEAASREAQIVGNLHRIETRPVEYAKALRQLLATNPTMTIADLAHKISASVTWLSDRFGLLKLDPKIQELVNSGELKLSNAYALAKLKPEEQKNFLDRAITEKPDVFAAAVQARVQEVREAERQGKEVKPVTFEAVEHLRKLTELKDERAKVVIGKKFCKEFGAKTADAGWSLCLDWILHMDKYSVEEAKAKFDARAAALAEAKARRQEEKDKKAAEKAANEAAKVQAEGAKAKAAPAKVV